MIEHAHFGSDSHLANIKYKTNKQTCLAAFGLMKKVGLLFQLLWVCLHEYGYRK